MFGRDARVRLFLAFLILVLVLVNSQSLQLSGQTRELITESFERSARAQAELIVSELDVESLPVEVSVLNVRLEKAATARGLGSACLLDWSARLVSGGDCAPAEGGAFDRLDRDGRRRLLEEGWAMTEVLSAYDPATAKATGYLVLDELVLRIEASAAAVAEANRRFRTTIIYQVSALSLVLLAMMLFLHSLLAPQRRLVAEARSVATELADGRPDARDEGEFLLGTFQEVVARLKLKEQELEALHRLEKARADASEALASDIVRSMTTGLVSLDPSGLVAVVNPAARKIFGVQEAQVRGRPFAEVFSGSPELTGYVEDALSRGTSRLRGQVRYPSSSETLHLGVSVIPLLSPEGRSKGALCLVADLSEVVELRERLFLKDNLARLGEMAAGIAHEFRNALATILGNARLLHTALEGEGEGESREVAEALIHESQALAHVVTEFLQFARPDALATESVDLEQLIQSLLDEHGERAREVGVELRFRGEPLRLEGDEQLLRKALSNLILNAVESFSGSTRDGSAHVALRLEERNGQAVIRVEDNGPGIAPEDRERVFTPFFTRKETGTGLGLSVVQKVVVSHNGTIDLEPTPGGGASFILRLPIASAGTPEDQTWV